VDATHLLVSWTPGPTKRGTISSWTVTRSPTDQSETGSDGNGVTVDLLAVPTKVGPKARSVVLAVKTDVLYGIRVFGTNASGDGHLSATVTAGAGAAPTPIAGSFQPYSGGGGYVVWTGGTSDPGLVTCSAVLVNGLRIDTNTTGPGQTVDNTTDPNGTCITDSSSTYLSALAPTDVLEVYARNLFGVTRVTVPHP